MTLKIVPRSRRLSDGWMHREKRRKRREALKGRGSRRRVIPTREPGVTYQNENKSLNVHRNKEKDFLRERNREREREREREIDR